MSDVEEKPSPLTLEQAPSSRSTCKATGEKIEKGQWRVGILAFRAGFESLQYQKAVPFLKACCVERCTKANSGSCKITSHKFEKGEVRFVCTNGKQKLFFTVPSAAKVLQPIIAAVKGDFSPEQFKGIAELAEAERAQIFKEFKVSAPKAKAFNKQHPPQAKEAEAADGPKPKAGTKRKQAPADAEEDKVKNEAEEPKEEEEPEENDEEDEDPADDIPEYEKERMAQIAKNRERMQALGIDQLVADITPVPQPAARRPPKRKRPKAEPAGPRRMSLRQKGVAADGRAIDQELRNGQVVLSSGGTCAVPTDAAQDPPQPQEKHPAGVVSFASLEGNTGSDERFLELLKKTSAPKAAKIKGDFGRTQLARLRLREQDVAKVTGNGITHLQWHPSLDRLLLAAADKSGSIGLWDVERTVQSGAEDEDDGVLTFAPHGAYISGLRWAGGGGAASRLFSVSYDGSMRVLDPARGAFELVLSSNGEAEYSAFDCSADGNTGVLADNDGDAHLYDVREHTGTVQGEPLQLHAKRINTVHFAPGEERLFVTSSGDNSLAIWDVRKLRSGGKPKYLTSTAHPYTCQSAYFAPDGSQRVVSTSRDDTIKVWDGKHNLKQLASIRHNNNTGRWIIPFRAIWSPTSDAIVVGNMKRTVDIYSTDGVEASAVQSEFMTAISSRHAIHPTRLALGAATASGRVNIYQ